MASVNFFTVLSVAVLLCFVIGIHNYLTRFEENKCEMTYMFEYPQYVKISFSGKIEKLYSRYGLYAYGEGQRTEKLRQMRFDGIPVLFIPGNSGSHKQVRSLASVSLRKSIDSHTKFHFDYFSIDFNEEYSALFGGVLREQTEFTHLCIRKILGLYKSLPDSPTSVILIGHSMGGMIAKGVFLEPDFDSNLVHLVITMATAHSLPVVSLDRQLADYYERVDGYWLYTRKTGHVTLVSIGGGTRDVLVRSGLTRDPAANISVVTSAMPTVWLSTDHVCSVWCKQLVLVIVRALFDSVSVANRQITTDSAERLRIFNYHLLERSAGKRASPHAPRVSMDVEGDWYEDIQRQYSVVHPHGVSQIRYIMVRLSDNVNHERLAAEAVYLNQKDWVFVCQASAVHKSSRVCESAENLSNDSRIEPSMRYRRKTVYLNLAELYRKKFSHVLLRIMPTKDMVQLNVDVYSTLSRRVLAPLPRWFSPSRHVVLAATPDRAVHQEVTLPGLEMPWQAYRLHVTPTRCENATHHATAHFTVPWSHETSHAHTIESENGVLSLKLHSMRPMEDNSSAPARVRLVLDPACRYSVSIESSVLDMLGQLARFYSAQLIAYLAAILLLAWRYQLTSVAAAPSFHEALNSRAKPYYLLPATKLIGRAVGAGVLAEMIPKSDTALLQQHGLDFFALPFILFLSALGLANLLGVVAHIMAVFSGHVVHKMAVRVVSGAVLSSLAWSEWILAGLARLPMFVGIFLAGLSLHTCGALSLCLALVFYSFKICKMYEDFLEHLLKRTVGLTSASSASPLRGLHFHITSALLLLTAAAVNLPCVLVWAHNYRYSTELIPDTSFVTSFILCLCVAFLWQSDTPQPNPMLDRAAASALFAIALIMLTHAQLSLFRLAPLIAAAFVVVTVHQLAALWCQPTPDPVVVEEKKKK